MVALRGRRAERRARARVTPRLLGGHRGDGGEGQWSDFGVKGTREGMERARERSVARGSMPSSMEGRGGCPREGCEREGESLLRDCPAAGGGGTCKRRVTPADLPLKSHFCRFAVENQQTGRHGSHEVKADAGCQVHRKPWQGRAHKPTQPVILT